MCQEVKRLTDRQKRGVGVGAGVGVGGDTDRHRRRQTFKKIMKERQSNCKEAQHRIIEK